jgi:hypothetical protein
MGKRKWTSLSAAYRTIIVASGLVQLGMTLAALFDIRRRPERQIKGSKRTWRLVSCLNFVGPVLYFAYGRRKET